METFVKLIEMSVRYGYDIKAYLEKCQNRQLTQKYIIQQINQIAHEHNLKLDENFNEII